jgi:hypothetical protein
MNTLLLGAILGAASTLVVQLLVQLVVQFRIVPRAEVRKRREDRWERDLRDLIELLKTSLSDRATDASAAQGLFWDLRQLEAEPGQDRDRIAKIRGEQVWETRKATRAFTDVAHTRVGLLTDEVVAFMPAADEIAKLGFTARTYWLKVAIASGWDENDTETEIEERWKQEYEARKALISQARLLADLPHPPRVSLPRRGWRRGKVRVRQAITRA